MPEPEIKKTPLQKFCEAGLKWQERYRKDHPEVQVEIDRYNKEHPFKPLPDFRAEISAALVRDLPVPKSTVSGDNIAIVWKYDRPNNKQTAIKVVVATPEEMLVLKRKYPEPEYGLETAWASDPKSFIGQAIIEGDTYSLGYDWFHGNDDWE